MAWSPSPPAATTPRLLLIVAVMASSAQAGYDSRKEPWDSLISEGELLTGDVRILGFSTREQEVLPREPLHQESLAVKILVSNFNYTEEMANKSSEAYIDLEEKLFEGLKSEFGPDFPDNVGFAGEFTLVSVEELRGKPLMYFYMHRPGKPMDNTTLERMGSALFHGEIGELTFANKTAKGNRDIVNATKPLFGV